MIIMVIQLIHSCSLSTLFWSPYLLTVWIFLTSNLSEQWSSKWWFSLFPALFRTKSIQYWFITGCLSFKKDIEPKIGSMIMKLSCFCFSILCRLNFLAMRPYKPWIPIPKAFVRKLAPKIYASGTISTWSFFRKLIILNWHSFGSILTTMNLDHAS